MPEHGGQLNQFADRYLRPVADWLDLSTGINPNGWPVPDIPAAVWNRLPEADDGLIAAAQSYYQTTALLPVAGSQAAIQLLPKLRPPCRVGILYPSYAEHAFCWQQAGHQVLPISMTDIEQHLDQLTVLIVIQPNNPTGERFAVEQLLNWHQQLASRGGWLIVDEAFVDVTPALSLAPFSPQSGLILLRSLGKFFGLAGLRVGFVLAEAELLRQLAQQLGPWSMAHPSRYLAQLALTDHVWQQQNRSALLQASQRLAALLTDNQLPPTGSTALFQWVNTSRAKQFHHQLAQQGILVRLFNEPASLRFGLPASEADWQRLAQALSNIKEMD